MNNTQEPNEVNFTNGSKDSNGSKVSTELEQINPDQGALVPEGEKKQWINWQQARVLSDRYLEIMLADWKGLLVLLIQAPLLAFMAVMVWGNVRQANNSLYFVMVLSTLWLGCIDSCREVVKELPLFLRERMLNLEIGAYLVSKIRVLFLLNGVQAIMYTVIVCLYLDVRVSPVWLGLNLLMTTLTGTCLGLLISSVVSRSDYAVGLVPLVILPQILFSEFAIKKDSFAGVSEVIYVLMPSRWSYESLIAFAETEVDYVDGFFPIVVLLIFSALFLILSYPFLLFRKYSR